jgi:hypothetical protein
MRQEITTWLVEVATVGQVMKVMEAGESLQLILKAVRARRPLKLQFVLD